MNPIQLQYPDGTPADCWQCGECKMFYRGEDKGVAERCCVCKRCEKSTFRGPQSARSYVCESCWHPYHAELAAKKLERAVELTDYDGPIVTAGDKYFRDMDALLDEMDDDELPEFVHTCHVHHYQVNPDNIYEMVLGDAPEDHDVDILEGVEAFNAAIAAFNAANSDKDAATWWEPDYKHKVRVPQPATQEVRP